MPVRLAAVGVLSAVLAACGGAPAATTPTTPSAPAPAPTVGNHSPGIAGVSVAPALGVSQLTAFHAHVNATDPDGDPVSIAWSSYSTPLGDRPDVDFTGCSCPPPSASIVSPVTVTVSDGKGGRATANVSFVVAGLTGEFDGYYDDGRGDLFVMGLKQTGNTVTGTFADLRRGHRGTTDPAAPGRVEADGRFVLRFKVESEPDFVLTGQFEPAAKPSPFLSDYTARGRVSGGTYDGRTFIFGIHDPY